MNRHLMQAAMATALMALVSANVAQTTTSAAKKELVQKVLLLQQPGIEATARTIGEQSIQGLAQQTGVVLQNKIAADKREAMGKDLQADFKKYTDEVLPLLRDRAIKLAPGSVGVLLEEKFTEDELKQIIAIMESPVNRKFQQLGAEMQRALTEKLVTETRAVVEPKLAALQETIGKRLGLQSTVAPTRPGSGAAAKPAAAASR